jgi:hypothetical protein
MINKLLVGATLKAFEDILTAEGVPFSVRDDEETRLFREHYDGSADKDLAYRQARPAVARIVSKEPYIFEKAGEPLVIRLNFLTREFKRYSF